MASEITVVASLAYVNYPVNINPVGLTIQAPGIFSITGADFTQATMSVPTTSGGTAIPIGSIGTLGWYMIKNTDSSNYVEIYNAVSGTKFLRLNAGEVALGRFAQSVVAPAAIANTGAVVIEYLFLEN